MVPGSLLYLFLPILVSTVWNSCARLDQETARLSARLDVEIARLGVPDGEEQDQGGEVEKVTNNDRTTRLTVSFLASPQLSPSLPAVQTGTRTRRGPRSMTKIVRRRRSLPG